MAVIILGFFHRNIGNSAVDCGLKGGRLATLGGCDDLELLRQDLLHFGSPVEEVYQLGILYSVENIESKRAYTSGTLIDS